MFENVLEAVTGVTWPGHSDSAGFISSTSDNYNPTAKTQQFTLNLEPSQLANMDSNPVNQITCQASFGQLGSVTASQNLVVYTPGKCYSIRMSF